MAETTTEQKNRNAWEIAQEYVGDAMNGITSFLTTDVRGIGALGVAPGTSDHVYYLKIQTPAWYPDSMVRSLQRSLYVKMVNSSAITGGGKTNNSKNLHFYQESGDGAILGALKGTLKTIASTAVGQITAITSQVDSAVSTVSSLFGDKKKATIEEMLEANNIVFLTEQPYVTIKGIHVEENVETAVKILRAAMSFFGDMKRNLLDNEKSNIGDYFKKTFSIFQDALIKAYGNPKITKKETLKEFFAQFNDIRIRQHSFSEKFMQQCVNGTYTMMTKIPYFPSNGGNVSFKSYGSNGFSGGVVGARHLYMKGFDTGLGLQGWSDPIEWSPVVGRGDSTFTPYTTTFTIVNDTFEHFMINYAFILSFISTTKATTDLITVRAPYLYDITIPGGSRYRLCTCDCSIRNVGRMRRLGYSGIFETQKNDNGTTTDISSIKALMKSCLGVDINDEAVQYIPDAYEVTMTFTSLLPDLWNFVDSYVKGLDEVKSYQMGARIDTVMSAFADEFEKQLNSKGGSQT